MRLTKRGTFVAVLLTAAVALPAGAAATTVIAHRGARPAVTLRGGGAQTEPGSRVQLRISATRTGVGGPIGFTVTGLPPSSTASFSPPRLVRGHATTLTVRTGRWTPEGRYRITVTGRAGGAAGRLVLPLVVERPGVAFSMRGRAVEPLSPGRTVPVAVTVHNPNSSALRVTELETTVLSTSSPGCAPGTNYRTVPYRGRPLTVPAGSSRSLADLGVPVAAWPRLTMLDLESNQDGCKNVRLVLGFSGHADGGEKL